MCGAVLLLETLEARLASSLFRQPALDATAHACSPACNCNPFSRVVLRHSPKHAQPQAANLMRSLLFTVNLNILTCELVLDKTSIQ